MTYIELFHDNNNGVILGFSPDGISAWRTIDGNQTNLFLNH